MNCPWDGYAPGTVSFCEERLCAWIVEPANSWSALAYVAVGIYLFATHARKAKDARLSLVCVAEVLIGLGSFAFHGTGTFAGEFFDLFGMFLLSAMIVSQPAGLIVGFTARATAALYAGITLGSAALMLVIRPIGIPVFVVQIVAGIALELWSWRRATGAARENYRLFFAAFALFAASFTIWLLDITKLVCDPKLHFLQGHAVWHVLNAFVVERLYRFYAARLSRSPVLAPSAVK